MDYYRELLKKYLRIEILRHGKTGLEDVDNLEGLAEWEIRDLKQAEREVRDAGTTH